MQRYYLDTSVADGRFVCMVAFGLLQDAAAAVGKKLAELCAEKNISKVCFDRGGFAYHGRVEVRSQGWSRGGGAVLFRGMHSFTSSSPIYKVFVLQLQQQQQLLRQEILKLLELRKQNGWCLVKASRF
jgi:hypothetical protein